MSVNIYDKNTGSLITVAGSSRIWAGSKAAHDAEALANTLPNNCLIAIFETGLFFRNSAGVETPIMQGGGGSSQVAVLPTPSIDNLGSILQYTGADTAELIHGYFYECIEQPVGIYKWSPIPVSDAEPDSITSEELSNMWND